MLLNVFFIHLKLELKAGRAGLLWTAGGAGGGPQTAREPGQNQEQIPGGWQGGARQAPTARAVPEGDGRGTRCRRSSYRAPSGDAYFQLGPPPTTLTCRIYRRIETPSPEGSRRPLMAELWRRRREQTQPLPSQGRTEVSPRRLTEGQAADQST